MNRFLNLKNMSMILIIILFLLFQKSSLYAQKIKFEHISSDKGLSQGSVTCIAQDNNGFMWFGTYDGLNRYDGFNFKIFRNEINNKNSISNNFVRTVLVDDSGTLWAGTQGGGINRYDSEHDNFIRYQHDPENSSSLSHDNIFQIYQDSFGSIWIATWGGGLDRIIPDPDNGFTKDLKFIHYTNDKNNKVSLADDRVSSVYEDKSARLWVSTRDGLSVFDLQKNKFIKTYLHNPDNINSLNDNNITKVLGDKNGNLWIGTWGAGLDMLNPDTDKFYHFRNKLSSSTSISYDVVMSLFTDHAGNLWIGTWGKGLNKLEIPKDDGSINPADFTFIKYLNQPGNVSSIAGNSIYSIFEDKTHVLWIGTDWNGLSKYDQEKSKFAHFEADPNDENGLLGNTILALYKDNYSNLWIGTLGSGLNKYNEKTKKYTHFTFNPDNPNSLSNNAVHSIIQDRMGRLWIGTESGLNLYDYKTNRFKRYYFDPTDKGSSHINYLYEDKDGFIWLGSWQAGLAKFDPQTNKFQIYVNDPNDPNSIGSNIIYSICEDEQNRLWIGTDLGGLNLYVKEKNSFKRFTHNPNDSTSLTSDKINTMLIDKKNELWIGSVGGLDKLILSEHLTDKPKFEHYTSEKNFDYSNVQAILDDEHGNLWLTSGVYLIKYNPVTNELKKFHSSSRLEAGEFTMNAVYKDLNTGKMYVGGVKGFNVFHPDSIQYNPIVPQTVITDFKISNKSVHINQEVNNRVLLTKSIIETDQITLSYKDDVLSFEFAALQYNSPEDNNYAYMMYGFEDDWNYVGNKREATYTNLDPGTYVFHVKGSNSDGVWNQDDTSISIIITPPFWETAWFRILAFLIIISSIYSIYKYRVRSIEAHRKELEMKVEERTHQLSEQAEELTQSNLELELSKKDLEDAKKETDNILENVNEGFFLLDKNMQISSQYSAALELIFSRKKLAQMNLIEFLKDKIPDDEVENSRSYLELLFNPDIDESQITDLNPLVDIQFTFKNKNSVEKKFLNFSFRRINSGKSKKIELIVTVRDVTQQILLSIRLKEEEARREKLLQLMLSILDVEPQMLSDFSESANRELNFIDKIMNHTEIDDYENLLTKVQRSIHLVKGNARLLNIDYFAEQAHKFEDHVSELLATKKLNNRVIEPLRDRLNEMRTGMAEMENIIEKIGKVLSHKDRSGRKDAGMLLHSLENLINSFSHDLGKKIKFNYKNFKRDIIPERYQLLIKEVLIQLVRNSISHGIETPDERQKLKKPEFGIIEISTFKQNGSIGLKFRDDGRGLQLEKLKQRAIDSGKWAAEEIEKWDNQKLADLIFASGITTSDKVDMVSGRGVGMDGVKHRLSEYNGQIQVHFDSNKYCEFEIFLPAAA